jgi:hypothetical protein
MKFRSPILVMLSMTLCAASTLSAQDFAIRTQIFQDGKSRPLAENLTIFRGDKIYDFLLVEPSTVTTFDITQRSFVLANPQLAQQTVVAADELIRFASEGHTKALKSTNELVKFAASPAFAESFDAKTGLLTLSSVVWDYEVETEVWTDADQQKRYGEFVHWYAYLNAMFRALPPGLRLELNQTLARRGRYPTRVIVRVKQDGEVVRQQESRHQLIHQLTASETKRLNAWLEKQPEMTFTDFVTFRKSQLESEK